MLRQGYSLLDTPTTPLLSPNVQVVIVAIVFTARELRDELDPSAGALCFIGYHRRWVGFEQLVGENAGDGCAYHRLLRLVAETSCSRRVV